MFCTCFTVTGDRYQLFLQDKFKFLLFLQRKAASSGEIFIQQDGFWPLTANAVLAVLRDHFLEQFRYGWSWLPPSADLHPCIYFSWGTLKQKQKQTVCTESKNWNKTFLAVVISVTEETVIAFVCDFQPQLQMTMDVDAHTSNVFPWLSVNQDRWTQRHQIQLLL
jgi:hypothetical protein